MLKRKGGKYARRSKFNILFLILYLLLFCVAVFSGYKVVTILLAYRESEKTYDQLHQYVQLPAPTEPVPSATPSKPDSGHSAPLPNDPSALTPESGDFVSPVDFAALRQINPDVVGWIYIEGTNINYPILQGENNDTYLYRLITGKHNSSGSIFMDFRNQSDFSDKNTVIYGHHMGDGSMFADLVKYRKQSFYDAHPTGYLFTPEKTYTLSFFSAYISDTYSNAWQMQFSSDAEFTNWLRDTAARSQISPRLLPTPADRILTLSTCTYEFDDARFVLYAIVQ